MSHTSRNLFTTTWTPVIFLAFLLACGAFLRYSDLSSPLLEFHPTRQLFGAIKARGIYYQSLKDIPAPSAGFNPEAPLGTVTTAWQRDMAVRQYSGEATIEPPLVENLAAGLYQVFGEQTAIPRAVSASFWLLGGLFLFLLSKNLTGSFAAAAFGLTFYLLIPYGVTASRAFQPDPLMTLLLLIFWWSIENWGRLVDGRRMTGMGKETEFVSWKWTLVSGISGGLAILVKFPAAFFVIGAALGVIFAYLGLFKSLKNPQTWVIILLGILPPGAYLYYGTFMDGFLGQQFGGRFYPELWINPFFYLRWFLKLENVVNTLWIALALLGMLVFSCKPVKKFLGSLWAAYLIFGMVFAHHISSHDYYSLPLIPIVALCLAQLAVAMLPGLYQKIRLSISLQLICAALLLSSILLTSIVQYIQQRTNDYRPQAAFWAEVGNAIGHQPGVIALTTDYGYPLAYYGWQNSSPWPATLDSQSADETFSQLTANKAYFLITDFDEYDRQPDLQKRLNANYPILTQGKGFMVFDLAHPKK